MASIVRVLDDASDRQTVLSNEQTSAALKRLSSSQIQGFHQIIAISEASINSIVEARFDAHLKRKKDQRLRHFKHSIADVGAIDAELSAPVVGLVVPGDSQSVHFILNFKTGSFTYPKISGRDVIDVNRKVDGWSVTFKTELNLAQVEGLPKDIRDKIALKAGSYSVTRLVMAFSAGAAAEVVDYQMPGTDDMSENDHKELVVKFKAFMDQYDLWLKSSTASVLGYAIKLDDTNSNSGVASATFAPTSLTTSTQEYVPQTDAFKQMFATRNGYDAIIFEEMTGNQGAPGTPYSADKAGNWITDSIPSSLAISRSLFFQQYLVPKLEFINLRCLDLAQHMFQWWARRDFTVKVEDLGNRWDIGRGQPKPTSTPFNFSDNTASYSWTAGNWASGNDMSGSHLWEETTITNSVTLKGSGNSIDMKIHVNQRRDELTHHTSIIIPDDQEEYSWSIDHTLTIVLSTVKDGELDVKVTQGTPTTSASDQVRGLDRAQQNISAISDSTVSTALVNALDMSSIVTEVQNALNGSSGFVFPGAGEFFMKSPVFNNEGDLLLELRYESKSISVDETFQLQVSVPTGNTNLASYNKKWLKVHDPTQDYSDVTLVDNQSDGTVFQINNGNLVVDVDGDPTTGAVAAFVVDPSNPKVRALKFVTAATFNKTVNPNGTPASNSLAFATSGPYFDFYYVYYSDPTAAGSNSKDLVWTWMDQFCLDASSNQNVQCWLASHVGAKNLFSLMAVF